MADIYVQTLLLLISEFVFVSVCFVHVLVTLLVCVHSVHIEFVCGSPQCFVLAVTRQKSEEQVVVSFPRKPGLSRLHVNRQDQLVIGTHHHNIAGVWLLNDLKPSG